MLIHNGDFEIGDFTCWTLAGTPPSYGFYYNSIRMSFGASSIAHSGSYGAFPGDPQIATLSQTISTVPGQIYLLSLWLQNLTNGPQQLFNVGWNTNNAVTNTIFCMVNPPAFSWTNLLFLVIATSSNTTLLLQVENDPSSFSLDDIRLTPVPMPMLQTYAALTNGIQFTWSTAPGVAYQVQYKTNLLQANWNDLTTRFVATNYYFSLLDTNAVGPQAPRFHRLSVRSP